MEKCTRFLMNSFRIFAFTIIIIAFSCINAAAQTTVSGVVKDAEGNLLKSVSVQVKNNEKIGTTTNSQGAYTIKVPSVKSVLVFSYVGFENLEVTVNSRVIINVELKEVSAFMDEVIMTGYTKTLRKDLTGAVGVVNIQDLQKAPVRSFEEALGGRVAGVQVVSNDGKPGSPITILIRGVGSISQSNAPLFVIDGLAIEDPDNDLIDPNNIESITVLKDASSTAIYGARGSNGVIVITTKKGEPGVSRINYAANYGVNKPVNYYKLLNPYEFVKVMSEQYGASNNPYLIDGLLLEDYRNVKGTDWQKELFRTGAQQNHSINVSGGNNGNVYFMSANILDQKGIIIASDYKRYQGKFSIEQKIGRKGKVGGFLTYTAAKITGKSPTATGQNSLFYNAYTYRPIPLPNVSQQDFEEATYDPSNGISDYRVNPIASAKNEIRNNINNNFLGTIYLNYNILKELKLTLRGSFNTTFARNDFFNGSNTRSGGGYGSSGINGGVNNYRYDTYDNTNLLEYNKTFAKKHSVNVLLGGSLQQVLTQAYGYSGSQIPVESLGLSGIDAGVINANPLGRRSENTLVSGFGSINYVYNNKYYLTTNFRADGSSKFVADNKWSYFPSASLKWKLSEEKFMDNIPFIADANIRFSIGKVGNNRVGDFDTYAAIDFSNPLFLNGNSQGNSAVTGTLANPKLKWETSQSKNLGFDFGFLKNRINLTIDLYKKQTNDLLYRASLPGSSGYSSTIVNIASMSNRGVEITLGADVVKNKNFSYNSSFNITFNRNRLEALSDPSQEAITSSVNWEAIFNGVPAYIARIGGPLGQIYGLISDGLYQYDDFDKMPNGTYVLKGNIPTNWNFVRAAIQPGDNKFVDINNDGLITADDRTVIGNGYPVHVGGWSNNITYKNFDFNIFFQWSSGNDIINANRMWFSPGLGISQRSNLFNGQNSFAEFANRWTPENQNTDIPKLNRTAYGTYSSQFVEDGSFIRLKTLNIGYKLPSSLLKKYKIVKMRVYVATTNIFTLTKYKGYDPEVSGFQTGLTPSLDYSTYPRPLTITAGVNLTF